MNEACPNCDHTKWDRLQGGSEWCRRCGTLRLRTGTLIHTPSMVEDYQRLVRKVDHGCTDQCCSECDPVPRPDDPLTVEEIETELKASGMGRAEVNEPARDLWLPNLGRDQPGAEGGPKDSPDK